MVKATPKRGASSTPPRAGGRSGGYPGGKQPFSPVTTKDKSEDGGSGSKYAKLVKLTPPKAKAGSVLLADLTRDRAEVGNALCVVIAV